jgi:dual specificity MAP kinase phosphatase
MSQILPRLWLGGIDHAHSNMFMISTDITHVLNCAIECPPYGSDGSAGLTALHIPLEDDEDGGEPEEIVEGARTLHEWLDMSGARVLVHCMAGISRSPTIVIAYLILYKGMGYEEAYDFVAAKRNFIRPIPYWLGILRGLEVVRESVLANQTL